MPISHKHQPLVYPDYINPLPVDDIIKVGAVKQDLYEKNYDKIQSHINELDKYGLEIVRENDKKYFSQEMNKFMKAVNESSGKTDFANTANVRNILSISRPIQNDQVILNSINSSAELRRRQKLISSLKPEERNPSNEWVFMKDVNDWQNNPEVGAVLSSGKAYTPFADPSEYLNDILPKVKANIRTEVVKKNGMIETTEIEELTNKELKKWMDSNLPQRYKDQIMMDAMYTVKDVSPEEMANHYFDTRKTQYDQIKNTMARYEANQKYLTEDQIQEYKDLALQASVLQDNLSNPPKTREEAYTSWINDHYNSYLTGQSDLYAYRQAKKKLQTDPFSLASYQSSLRNSEAYYRNITIPQQQQRLGLPVTGQGGGKGTSKGKKTEKELEEEAVSAEIGNDIFNRLTKGATGTWQNVNANLLSDKEVEKGVNEKQLIQNALKDALISYNKTDIPADIDLNKVQIKKTEDGTYQFRIDTGQDKSGWFTGNVVYDVYQDKFDEAFRKNLGLENYDYMGSVDTRARRNEEVDESGNSLGGLTEDELRRSWSGLLGE
jgi:Fe-S cluster biosynthesis and repair protein YggX